LLLNLLLLLKLDLLLLVMKFLLLVLDLFLVLLLMLILSDCLLDTDTLLGRLLLLLFLELEEFLLDNPRVVRRHLPLLQLSPLLPVRLGPHGGLLVLGLLSSDQGGGRGHHLVDAVVARPQPRPGPPGRHAHAVPPAVVTTGSLAPGSLALTLLALLLLLLASELRREIGRGDILVLAGAEVALPCGPPMVDDPAVVLRNVRHHLPLVVDVTGHRHLGLLGFAKSPDPDLFASSQNYVSS